MIIVVFFNPLPSAFVGATIGAAIALPRIRPIPFVLPLIPARSPDFQDFLDSAAI